MSEKVYNFQRAMNVWMGRGTRKDDRLPFRAMGPVTEMEYLSRKDRYDKQLVDNMGLAKEKVVSMTALQKLEVLKEYRLDQYQKLSDAVYCRRGWTQNGIPTPQKMKSLGFTDKWLLDMLREKIDADEKAGLNAWGGKYAEGDSPPNKDRKYWEI